MPKYWQRGWITRRELEVFGLPVGDPFRGAAYGERLDPVLASVGSSIVGSLISSDSAQ